MSALGKTSQITPNNQVIVLASLSTDRCVVKERQELYVSFKSPLADHLGVVLYQTRMARTYMESFKDFKKLQLKLLQSKVVAQSKV